MNKDLTRGPVMGSMLLFAVPMILGNLLQQCYNVADTLIVGQFLGKNALAVIFCGIFVTFLYNYFASFLRAVDNSVVPLIFLEVSAVLNIFLDLWFVLGLEWGVAGAAEATVAARYVSSLGIAAHALVRCPS